MKRIILSVFVLVFGVCCSQANAQGPIAQQAQTSPSITTELLRTENTLREAFGKKGLIWPAREIYIRSFKYDSQLEVWARNSDNEPFKLFKTYKVCVMAGTIGPKRIEGDYQVPEGFYYISGFNPRSEYHLSLKLNYPNESDKLLSDKVKPGGGIYIHGNCVSVGCIPLQNDQIDEVYLLATAARLNGQNYIPVHVFPVRFDNEQSLAYYTKYSFNDVDQQHFTASLKPVYDYFEQNHELPLIGVDLQGDYNVLN
ncbi:L,D-transpeptidase catalytic domain [Arachidicoccus rhizosphaerae]|jgi:murein L,D-transpeptidase YafK|uniref:L,D-transpeptidase catalytic domain n=1 Tax=Arachidicoccus rhizosphaerae TaxID=551991 RepID=A0A1H4BPS9_9BACT|nr:L,D-transpeptidase family protein [Arachidicoccus rhizosphaerae]SEA50171.1 L,D-transpeptidase catalytic domain [Arachidicoccus rhizosphaerae]